jgi:hypothetical protein
LTIPGIEPGPPRWEASDQPLQLWRGPSHILVAYGILLIANKKLFKNGGHRRCELFQWGSEGNFSFFKSKIYSYLVLFLVLNLFSEAV